ncbi:MAG: Gfo/Idh/MocA family oxidoreductase [Planctomycetes bacterium]|nr:Gfo/Idh/MocA family oxidoreductase [Planctomycetota bacterium]
MGLRVGICGTGSFAQCFIPLIKAHPLVSKVVLCDLVPEKLQKASEEYGIPHTCPSLDKLVQMDVDAVALFTQNDRHAPQAVQALKAGKHVYSAVPSAITMAELTDLVRTVESTGMIYMIGETSYYYPCAIYCRDRFRKGDFGYAIYGEGEYFHDYSHGMEQVARSRFGDQWMRHVTMPPFFYPTHSVSMITGVTGAYAVKVCGMGVKHQVQPGEIDFTKVPDRIYPNDFWNEIMLCQMSDGSTARFIEARRIGYCHRPGSVGMSLYGSEGSFEQQIAPPDQAKGQWTAHHCVWSGKSPGSIQDVTDLLDCRSPDPKEAQAIAVAAKTGLGPEAFTSMSKVHPVQRLPREFVGLRNGHEGSHQFLVHDFITACVDRIHPPNNVWQAARYLAPGLIAHESAMRGGVLMDVPDFGAGSGV